MEIVRLDDVRRKVCEAGPRHISEFVAPLMARLHLARENQSPVPLEYSGKKKPGPGCAPGPGEVYAASAGGS